MKKLKKKKFWVATELFYVHNMRQWDPYVPYI